jgi:hypothetical protein
LWFFVRGLFLGEESWILPGVSEILGVCVLVFCGEFVVGARFFVVVGMVVFRS